MRKIDVDGEQWQFQVGKRFAKLRGPDGRGYTVPLQELLGRPQDEIDRARRPGFGKPERWRDATGKKRAVRPALPGDPARGAVTPKHIRWAIINICKTRLEPK